MTVVAPFVLQIGTGPIIAAVALLLMALIAPIIGLAILFDVYRTNRRIADSLEGIERQLETVTSTQTETAATNTTSASEPAEDSSARGQAAESNDHTTGVANAETNDDTPESSDREADTQTAQTEADAEPVDDEQAEETPAEQGDA